MPLATTTDRDAQTSLGVVEQIFESARPADFAVRLWDGTQWGPDPGQRVRFTIVLTHPGSLRAMLVPPTDLSVGEAFVYGDFDVEGDVEALVELGSALTRFRSDKVAAARLARDLMRLPGRKLPREGRSSARVSGGRHSKRRDAQAISFHYDVGNDFYGMWLDREMVYSCAYFSHAEEDLDAAQARKLDYICRKLRLKPGERLLDIGCGWGGLVRHAAREYGARAVGITLSEPQAAYAHERIAAEGLSERCAVELADYRDVDEDDPFDKLVSVGMFEHVGEAKLPAYFAKARRLLRPGGAFLNHGIACNATGPSGTRGGFSERYVFPDGELTPVSTSLGAAEREGFEVRDVESLREHYALTLRNWVRRLEERAEDARRATDEATYRTWRLYMAASANGFSKGNLQVYQALLVKPDDGISGVPLSRADWYA